MGQSSTLLVYKSDLIAVLSPSLPPGQLLNVPLLGIPLIVSHHLFLDLPFILLILPPLPYQYLSRVERICELFSHSPALESRSSPPHSTQTVTRSGLGTHRGKSSSRGWLWRFVASALWRHDAGETRLTLSTSLSQWTSLNLISSLLLRSVASALMSTFVKPRPDPSLFSARTVLQ